MTFKQAARGNYSPGRTSPISYIVIHYTANSGDTAQNNLDYFARTKTGTSAHYFVDENEVCQSVKDMDVAWHCGRSDGQYKHPYCRNSNSIGIEMCNSLKAVPEATRTRTAAFVRELMSQYGIPAQNVLRHYDVTGKRCPAPWVDNTAEWDEFKSMLEGDEMTQDQFDAMMENYLARRGEMEPSEWYTQKTPQHPGGIREEAMVKGITDGTRPKSFATREEVAAMVNALSKG